MPAHRLAPCARAVGEHDAGNSVPVDPAGRERNLVVALRHLPHPAQDRQVAVEKPEQFGVGQLADQLSHRGVEVLFAPADGVDGVGEGGTGRVPGIGHGHQPVDSGGLRRCGRAGRR